MKSTTVIKQSGKIINAANVIANTEIIETTEYNVFVLDIRNRPIDEDKVQTFMKSFKENKNFMREFPGTVDSTTWIILDGQHRFEALKRLSMPFVFRFTLPDSKFTINNVADVQHNAGWKSEDYLHTYIKQGNQNYVEVSRFVKRYNMSVSIAVMLLTSLNSKGELQGKGASLKRSGFYTGSIEIKNVDKAHMVAKRIEEFGKLGFKYYANSKFITALVAVMNHPDYDHKEMINKASQFGASLLKPQTTTEYYLRNLEELYNYRTREENRLRFDRKETSQRDIIEHA